MDTILVSRSSMLVSSKPLVSPIRTPSHQSLAWSPKSLLSFTFSQRKTTQLGSCRFCSKPRAKSSFSVTCGAGIREIDETQFPNVVLESDGPVLVEFVATWCGPCRLIAPAMEWLAQEYKEKLTVVKIDHDANQKLIEEYKVYGLPALILFKNGKEVPESRWEGAMTKAKLKDYIDPLLELISVV